MSLTPWERNSEGKLTVAGVIGGIVLVLAVVADQLVGTPLIPAGSVAETIMTIVASMAALLVGYTLSRPSKTQAVVTRAAMNRVYSAPSEPSTENKPADPPSPPSS